jgi:hypothetical protein
MTTTKEVSGSFIYGADDSLFEIGFDAEVDTKNKQVTNMNIHLENGHIDNILQNVYKSGAEEALRVALKQGGNENK